MLTEYAERAAGGTLFLDEMAEATAEFQSAILRLLPDGELARRYRRGARPASVRIVASTNRVLAHEMAAGRIRPDLYFALNVIAIQVAPLRERKEDILPLARHFVALHRAESGRPLILTADAEDALTAYRWPGNVRELENVIERAVVMSSSERISADALMIRAPGAHPATQEARASAPAPQAAAGDVQDSRESAPATETQAAATDPSQYPALPVEGTLQEFLDRAATLRVRKAIEAANGDRNAAAEALGIDRATLNRLTRRLAL